MKNNILKMLRYFYLLCVIAFGLMAIIGSGGGGGDGDDTNSNPTANITSPSGGSSYTEGETITFSGTGSDPEDGTLTGSSLVWTSNINGPIETGTSLSTASLSVGTHTITLTATDSNGATGSDSVSIMINTSSLNDGLVAYYPFNGNANDESGNGNHGSVHGAVLTDDRLGFPERAYSFDGSDDYISVAVTLPYGSAPRSVSLWFNTTSTSGSNGWYTNTAASWGSSSTNQLCSVAVYHGNLMFGAFGNSYDVNTGINVADGIWHHTVVAYDGSTLKIYLDNTEVASVSRTLNTTNNGTFLIGDRVGQSTHNMDGLIDDVRVYDRALSVDEVETLYH